MQTRIFWKYWFHTKKHDIVITDLHHNLELLILGDIKS